MGKLDTAKQLLRKGIALGDQELIDMANALLGDSQPTTKEELKWFCPKCENTFENPLKKKSCPNCKGRKIQECPVEIKKIEVQEIQEVEINDDPLAQFRIKKNNIKDGKRIEIDNETGESKNYGKAVEINNGKNIITSEDLANLHKEDSEFDKKVFKGNLFPRRKPFKLAKAKCYKCSNIVEVSPILLVGSEGPKQNFICNKCSRKSSH